jgi:hypothetical protein
LEPENEGCPYTAKSGMEWNTAYSSSEFPFSIFFHQTVINVRLERQMIINCERKKCGSVLLDNFLLFYRKGLENAVTEIVIGTYGTRIESSRLISICVTYEKVNRMRL